MKYLGKHKVFDDLMIGGVLLTPPDPATYAYELTLPNDDGASGQVLSTNGSGVLSWVANGVAVPNALTVGDGLQLNSGTTWDGSSARTISADLKSNGGLVIESEKLAVDLGGSSITGVLADSDVAQDLTIVAGTINNTPIGASTANTIAGTTIDASTDFTVGSTVITDDQIQFTPSTSDTVTIAAATNGALNITTHDGSGAKQANVTITATGTAEIAAAGDITLDSANNIELEVGSATKYVNTDGLYRGGNIGDIQYVSSVYYIPITATDFQGMSDARGNCLWGMEGLNGGEWASHGGQSGFIEKIIPLGFTATSCAIYGDTGTNTFQPFESSLDASTTTSRGSATAVGSTCTFSSNVVGDGNKTVSIKLIVGESRDFFFGGKLTLIKT